MLSLGISLDFAQVINLAQTVERLLQDSKISPLDKLRLIVMYIGARAYRIATVAPTVRALPNRFRSSESSGAAGGEPDSSRPTNGISRCLEGAAAFTIECVLSAKWY